jgi:hypothetical protein
MSMNDIDHKLIVAIDTAVSAAEARINHLGDRDPKIDVAALNELRYSLRHLLSYLGGANVEEAKNSIKHAKRALYDCYQAEGLSYIFQIQQLEDQFRQINLIEAIPEYLNAISAIEDLQESFEKTPNEGRDKYCEEIESKLVIVRPFARKLRRAGNEIAKSIDQRNVELAKTQADVDAKNRENDLLKQQLEVAKAALEQSSRSANWTKYAAIAAFVAAAGALAPILTPQSTAKTTPEKNAPEQRAPSKTQ